MKKSLDRKESVVATFTLIVEYEELPDQSSLEELVEKARELGGPITATLEIHKTTSVNLL